MPPVLPDARTRAILDGMSAAVAFTVGPNHEFAWRNRSCAALHGDLEGLTARDAIAAHYVDVEPDLLDGVWRTGVSAIRERARFRRPNHGTDRWMDLAVHPWVEGGERIGLWIELHDVSALVTAWREAEAERRNLFHLFEQAPAIIAIRRGEDLVGQFFSHPYVELLGGRELVGKSLRDSVPEARRQLPIHEHVFRTGETIRHDAAIFKRRPNDPVEPGGEVCLNLVYQPLRDADGRVVGTMIHGVDVTGQARARREAEAERARVEDLLATLDAVVWERPFGEEHFSFLTGRLDMFGWARERWDEPGFWTRVLHPEDRERVLAASHADADVTIEYRIRREDGQDVWVQDVIRVFHDVHGRPLHQRGVLLDIRARRAQEDEQARIQAQLVQAQKLESLGVLAGGIAHDFNNLLSVILGNASLASLRVGEGHPARSSIDDIVATGQRAADLTRQLLAYAGRARTATQPLDLGAQVREIVQLLDASVSKKVKLQLDLGRDLPDVEADPAQLQQVVMNLVLNGAEAIPASGTVRVSTRADEVRPADRSRFVGGEGPGPGPYVVLCVEDDGAGMDPETLSRIFDPFFSTKATGRGLGLAALAGIVRTHRGGVRIDTTPGAGTRFEVWLPAAARPAAPASGPELALPRHGRGRILVTDDEAVVRATARAMLEHLGYTVLEAAHGEACLDVVARHDDLAAILLDKSMPVMDGDECLRQLCARDNRVPVILTSGYPDPAEADRPYQGFLQKPYTVRQLAEAVARVLADRS